MKRDERLNLIAQFVTKEEIKTQSDLVDRLLASGIQITQATVSRDIKTLDLIKVPASTGGQCYSLPNSSPAATSPAQSSPHKQSLVADAILDVRVLDKMVSIQTQPGTAALVKKDLRAKYDLELFSVLADDDSLLAVFDTTLSAKRAYEALTD